MKNQEKAKFLNHSIRYICILGFLTLLIPLTLELTSRNSNTIQIGMENNIQSIVAVTTLFFTFSQFYLAGRIRGISDRLINSELSVNDEISINKMKDYSKSLLLLSIVVPLSLYFLK